LFIYVFLSFPFSVMFFLLMTKGGVVESIWLRLWAQAKMKIYNIFI